MHRYSRLHLSPADALRRLDTVDLEEKARLAEGLALIAVVDHRRDYLAAGYGSMHQYCTERLRMSPDQALRRIQVARAGVLRQRHNTHRGGGLRLGAAQVGERMNMRRRMFT